MYIGGVTGLVHAVTCLRHDNFPPVISAIHHAKVTLASDFQRFRSAGGNSLCRLRQGWCEIQAIVGRRPISGGQRISGK